MLLADIWHLDQDPDQDATQVGLGPGPLDSDLVTDYNIDVVLRSRIVDILEYSVPD
jgi:hypothetical protein